MLQDRTDLYFERYASETLVFSEGEPAVGQPRDKMHRQVAEPVRVEDRTLIDGILVVDGELLLDEIRHFVNLATEIRNDANAEQVSEALQCPEPAADRDLAS